MGTIFKAKEGTIVSYNTITTNNKAFLLTTHTNTDTITMYIGGHDKYCIEAQIFKENSTFSSFIDISVGNLSQIYFNVGCSLKGGFKRGEDTNLIIQLMISYINKTYPYIKSLSFTDASFRSCDNGHTVGLAEMSFITTGKTWYELHYKAYIETPYKVIVDENISNYNNLKKKVSWEMMTNYIRTPPPTFTIEQLHILFDNSTTWQEFFSTIRNTIGISTFCIFISPWLHLFVKSLVKIPFSGIKYLLPLDNYVEYTLSISNRRTGGKRYTHKRIYQANKQDI